MITKINPCLWFDGRAEEAAHFYVSVFPNSRITAISYYGEAGHEIHRHEAGTVLTVTFDLNHQSFTALNGGPEFKFNEAVSFQIDCVDQVEIDYYWSKLSEGGDPSAQVCGWLKDKFGVSWQVVPKVLAEMICDPGTQKTNRIMEAIHQMKKLDLAELQRAFHG